MQRKCVMKLSRIVYIGIFTTTLATLILELTLTRIFSVTMWYHFAFMTISLVLLGISAAGVIVFLYDKIFSREKVAQHVVIFSIAYALSLLLAIVVYLWLPLVNTSYLKGIIILISAFVIFFIPLLLGGFILALLFTHYSEKGSLIYTADLLGAGAGCIMTTVILRYLSGPTAVILVTFLIGLAALIFSIGSL